MDFTAIISYLLTDKFMFVFFNMLLNIISVIMLGGLLKAILKQIPGLEDSNWRRIAQMLCNILFGGVIGYMLYSFEISTNILLGASAGYLSSVAYKIAIKKIYDKFGVNCESNSLQPPNKDD